MFIQTEQSLLHTLQKNRVNKFTECAVICAAPQCYVAIFCPLCILRLLMRYKVICFDQKVCDFVRIVFARHFEFVLNHPHNEQPLFGFLEEV